MHTKSKKMAEVGVVLLKNKGNLVIFKEASSSITAPDSLDC